MVERWFREITDKQIRRGVFESVDQLTAMIEAYIKSHNEKPRSFVWTAKAEDIPEKVRRAKAALDKIATAGYSTLARTIRSVAGVAYSVYRRR